MIPLLFKSPQRYRGLLVLALAIYIASKFAGHYDRGLFALTGHVISGHALKHPLAALSMLGVWMECADVAP